MAAGSAVCSAFALITVQLGLRHVPVRVGASFSVPCAFVLFALLSPLTVGWREANWPAIGAFALIGLFFPATVTLLSFASNERYGGPITGAISGTAPLFALPAAALVLGEAVPPQALVAAVGIAFGIAMLSLRRSGSAGRPAASAWPWIPLASAAVRGLSQVAVKAALLLWPSAFAATLIGYAVSSVVLVLVVAGRSGRGVCMASAEPARRFDRRGIGWFALTGCLNGASVLLLYVGLTHGPVALVAPVVATVPLIAIVASRVLLPGERLSRQALAGIAITVASVFYLVS